jgi:hypothetical protein
VREGKHDQPNNKKHADKKKGEKNWDFWLGRGVIMQKNQKLAFMHDIKMVMGRISELPEYMQELLLKDLNTAIENRIAIMENISRQVPGRSS